MKVLKFGGSSVAQPERIRAVAGIVATARREGEIAVVVSAFGGVTDALLAAAQAAERGEPDFRTTCTELRERHQRAIVELAPPAEQSALETRLGEALGDLHDLLHGVSLVREASPRTLDSILSYGERLSAAIVAAALRQSGLDAEDCDARGLLLTDREFGQARVDFEASYRRIRDHFAAHRRLQVVTGFIAATTEGETTTLGRGGSDYTAALLGAALDATAVELWTDVDGVMNADPRLVPDAAPLAEISYAELMELSHFGAKVVYPPSVHPTHKHSIPLLIKNTFNPGFPGTLVSYRSHRDDGNAPVPEQADGSLPGMVAGISSIPRVALLRLEGDGMVGVPGTAMRLFGALARRNVNVILISQASSEHSICLAVAPAAVETAARSVREEFALEQRAGLIDELVIERGLAAVAVVGAGMRDRPGVAGRLFGLLGDHGISVRAIAQGSSELNISLVVFEHDQARAVTVLHQAFFSPLRTVEVVLAGCGRVGATLLDQLQRQVPELERDRRLSLRLTGLAGRRGAVTASAGLDPGSAAEQLRHTDQPLDPEQLVAFLSQPPRPRRVFVDCTASPEVAALYERLRGAGVSVVTANKLRLAGPLADYRRLLAASPGGLFYEATVGAGLPVIHTLADLCATGDRVERIEGLFSGTLTFLTDQLAGGTPFSAAMRQAHDLGFTEPDPREDLSGRDVARKLLILARLAGFALEPEQVAVEPLLPAEPWAGYSLDELWRRLPAADADFAALQHRAAAAGQRLCYLATVSAGGARVALTAVDTSHPAASARGSDNLIACYTARYASSPLVVRGPGAGPEVTAAGVFADVLRAAQL